MDKYLINEASSFQIIQNINAMNFRIKWPNTKINFWVHFTFLMSSTLHLEASNLNGTKGMLETQFESILWKYTLQKKFH